ncbi:hypothetical protein SC171_27190 [Pantoea cypripedii]|uniref:hypothetical protein n=1 Tax=Pantoea cypripedii TaxID=55209 RepID=UPI002FC9D5CE
MINNINNSVTPLVSSTSENNTTPQPVPIGISNVNTLPRSMTVTTDNAMEINHSSVQNEVTPETFVDFMNKRNATTVTPTTFRNINFSIFSDNDYKFPLHFNGDTFIDARFPFFNHDGTQDVIFNGCTFVTREHELLWGKLNFKNTNWQGSTINGLYKGSKSEITSCFLNNVDMSGCTLKNFSIYDSDHELIIRANFDNCVMEDMVFYGERMSYGVCYYRIEDTSFRNMQATNLEWDVVECVKNVDLTNAKLTDFLPLGGTDLSGVIWGDYQPRQSTIGSAMFDSEEKIDISLDSLNNHESGALFLNTLDSITNLVVKRDFGEQLVEKIRNLPLLSATFAHSRTLRQSIITHLAQPGYAESPAIQTFIRDELLKEGHDIIIPPSLRPIMLHIFSAMEESKLLDYQFMVNQLIAEYPSLRQKLYQLTPIKEFIYHIEEKIMMPDKDSLYHIFYHPDDRKTALYIPAEDYKGLMESNQAPQLYSFLRYQPDKDDIVTDKAATIKRQSRVLSEFPALHELWIRAAGLFTPIIHALFEQGDKLDAAQTARAAEIKNHLISIIKRQADNTVKLTDEKDACLLSEIMAPFYIDGDHARNLREQLIELIQQQLGLSSKNFPDREQKIIALRIIIRMLPDIFSTRYYSIEEMSPYAPRQLAKKLLDDLVTFAPEILDVAEAKVWRDRLVTDQESEFTCSAALATRMGNYQIPGERGQEMNKAIKLYYPLN